MLRITITAVVLQLGDIILVPKPKLDVFSTYMAMIEGSVGTNAHRKMYYIVAGKPLDVLFDGDLSCAVFATFMLFPFGLIKEWHTTVTESVRDMEESGWYKIPEPRRGAVILWGFKKKDDGTQGKHRHLGFYIDDETAISNDSDSRVPFRHHPTYGTFPDGEARRDIQAFYWHDSLN